MHNNDGNPIQNLNDVIKLWQKLHPTPNQESMLKLLTELSQHKLKSLPTFRVKCSNLPTAADLIHDIFADPKIQYQSALMGKEEGNMKIFSQDGVLWSRI